MRAILCACLVLVTSVFAAAQDDGDRPFVEGRVAAVEPAEAKPGATVVAKIRLEIPEGWHIYPLAPTRAGLPTTVEVSAGPFAVGKDAKEPAPKKFGTDPDSYEAHVGSVVLEIPLVLAADAKPGEAEFALALSYMMCTEEQCLPPTELALKGRVKVVAGSPSATVPDDVVFEADITYGKGGETDLKLNLARPKDAKGPLPAVVVIHGGGWKAGDRTVHDNLTWLLAQHGFAAATIEYRLCPKDVWPAQIEDAKCAVRFLRANAAKYGLDGKHVGAVGFSAGAHLALMLGTVDDPALEGKGGWEKESSKVQAVVSFFGPTDLLAKDLPKPSLDIVKEFIGGTAAEKGEAWKAASPVTHVSAGDAPALLIQGTKDPLIPTAQATAMAEALTKAGVKARCDLLEGKGHGWGGAELLRNLDETYEFFGAELKPAR